MASFSTDRRNKRLIVSTSSERRTPETFPSVPSFSHNTPDRQIFAECVTPPPEVVYNHEAPLRPPMQQQQHPVRINYPPTITTSAGGATTTVYMVAVTCTSVALVVLIAILGYYMLNIPSPALIDNDQLPHRPQMGAQSLSAEEDNRIKAAQSRSISSAGNLIVCFINASAVLRAPPYDYDVTTKTCPKCCTHIVYVYARIAVSDSKISLVVPQNDAGEKTIRSLSLLKDENPHLRLLISIHIDDMSNVQRAALISDQATRVALGRSINKWLTRHTFDGVHIEWHNVRLDEKMAFVDVVKMVKSYVSANHQVFVGVHPKRSNAYNIELLHAFSDFVIIFPYELDGQARLTLPPVLYDEDLLDSLQVILTQLTLKKQKLLIALPFFGYAYHLANEEQTGIRAPAAGYAGDDPRRAYYEVCRLFTSNTWKAVLDRRTQCKIAVNQMKHLWIGYDNPATLTTKLVYIKQERLGGVALMTIDMDDYQGDCGHPNALTNQAYSVFNKITSK